MFMKLLEFVLYLAECYFVTLSSLVVALVVFSTYVFIKEYL